MGDLVGDLVGNCLGECMGDDMGDCMLYGRNLYGRLGGRCGYETHTIILHTNLAANTSTSNSTTSFTHNLHSRSSACNQRSRPQRLAQAPPAKCAANIPPTPPASISPSDSDHPRYHQAKSRTKSKPPFSLPSRISAPRRRQSRIWTRRPRSPGERDLYLLKNRFTSARSKARPTPAYMFMSVPLPIAGRKVDKFHHLVGFSAEEHGIEVLPPWTSPQHPNCEMTSSRRGTCLCLLRRGRRLMMSAWELPSKWGGEE